MAYDDDEDPKRSNWSVARVISDDPWGVARVISYGPRGKPFGWFS